MRSTFSETYTLFYIIILAVLLRHIPPATGLILPVPVDLVFIYDRIFPGKTGPAEFFCGQANRLHRFFQA